MVGHKRHSKQLVATGSKATGINRIGFVSNNCAGLYLFRRGIMHAMVDAGYDVVCIAPTDNFTPALLKEGFAIYPTNLSGYGKNMFEEYTTYTELLALYESLQLDAIFHYTIKPNIYGSYAAYKLGIPSVAIVTGLGTFPDIRNPLLKLAINKLYRGAARRSREVWFLNRHDQGYFEGQGWLEDTPTRILPSEGVDTSYYQVNPLPSGRKLKVLFAGRLIKRKGILDFCDAAQLLQADKHHLEFNILGLLESTNPDRIGVEKLRELQQSNTINYLGETQDVRPYIADCDILVLPTMYREGMSRIILEAMSMARPVITTNATGSGELVEHMVNGFIVPKNNPAAIASAIESFLAMSVDARTRMGLAGRRIVERSYDERYVIAEYFSFLKSLHPRPKSSSAP